MGKFRLLALLLASVLLLGSLPVGAAEGAKPLLPKVQNSPGFTEVKGTWCEAAVKTVHEAGLMEGVSATHFSPSTHLSYGQIFTIAARLHSRLSGGNGVFPTPKKGHVWCQSAYDYLMSHVKQVGDMVLTQPSEVDFFSQPCQRRFFADVLWATLTAASVSPPEINQVDSIPDGGATPAEAVLSLYRAGILAGKNQYGFFDGSGILTRGEAAVMLARVIDPAQRLTFSLTKSFDLCEALGTSPDTVLFRIADTDVTAGQCAYLLATGITTDYHYDHNLLWSEAYTQERIKQIFAVNAMATHLGLTLSKEELTQMQQRAAAMAGELGASKESWLWYKQAEAIHEKVKQAYFKEFAVEETSPPTVPEFTATLKKVAADLTWETTAAYEALDLAAFQKALLDSGAYGYHGLAPAEQSEWSPNVGTITG